MYLTILEYIFFEKDRTNFLEVKNKFEIGAVLRFLLSKQ